MLTLDVRVSERNQEIFVELRQRVFDSQERDEDDAQDDGAGHGLPAAAEHVLSVRLVLVELDLDLVQVLSEDLL